MSNIVAEIVITGGPCGGKTSALPFLVERLTKQGLRVLVAEEYATAIIMGGARDISELSRRQRDRYLKLQLLMLARANFYRVEKRRIAQEVYPNEGCVILFDRGPMDVAAYVEPLEFSDLLRRSQMNLEQACHSFDAIFHLMTAARGAEQFYTQENNAARREGSLAEAVMLDLATQRAWSVHRHHRVIDNSTDFEGKLLRLLESVQEVIGVEASLSSL